MPITTPIWVIISPIFFVSENASDESRIDCGAPGYLPFVWREHKPLIKRLDIQRSSKRFG